MNAGETGPQAWYTAGDEDLAVARRLLREDFALKTAAFHLQQTAEKYLKGFLLSHGWRLQKIHDLEVLINEAMQLDAQFSIWLPTCRNLSEYYIEVRYPPILPSEFTLEELAAVFDDVEEMRAYIRGEASPSQ